MEPLPLTRKLIDRIYKKRKEDPNHEPSNEFVRLALGAIAKCKDPGCLAACRARVALIYDWGNIPPRALPASSRMDFARDVHRKWKRLSELQAPIGNWLDESTQMDKAIVKLEGLLQVARASGKSKSLSFTSKFLHWCVSPQFPIFDSYTRGALRFQCHEDKGWTLYRRWAKRIQKEIADHRKDNPKCGCRLCNPPKNESVVRVLDIVLWQIGKDKKEKRDRRHSRPHPPA